MKFIIRNKKLKLFQRFQLKYLSKYEDYNPLPIEDTIIKENSTEKKHKVFLSNYRFVDKANIEVHGGKGGNGCASFEILSPSVKRPNGGNGGAGGNVYIVADKTMTHLALQRSHFNGGNGSHGGADGMTGRRGDDFYIKVPCGTIVTEKVSNSELLGGINETDMFGNEPQAYDADPPTVDLDEHGKCILVARGGKPGIGNKGLSSGKARLFRSMSLQKSIGHPGQHKSLFLELKSIADVGLVGYPNAGKSTLLASLSNARPKIAPYPFTTLHPNIGVIQYSDHKSISMADIPGIIDGASVDRGLGHEFLRHIERTKIIVYVIDGSGTDERLPGNDLKSLLTELKEYDNELIKKPSLVFLNKVDIENKDKLHENLKRATHRLGLPLLKGSAKYSKGVGELADKLRELLELHNKQTSLKQPE